MSRRSSPRRATPVEEAELAAIASTLLARPAMWPQLVLSPQAPQQAQQAPWSAWWSLRVAERVDPADERATLERAYEAFVRAGDPLGAQLACSSAIETFYHEELALDGMDVWIERLDALLDDGSVAWPNVEFGAEVMACGIARLLRQPRHPRLSEWASRAAHDVLRLPRGPSHLRLATFLLHHHLRRSDFGASALVVDSLPGIDWKGVRRCDALPWLAGVASHARHVGDLDRGREAVQAGLALLEPQSPASHAFSLNLTGTAIAIAARDVPAAAQYLDAARQVLDGRSLEDQTNYWYAATGVALLRGQNQAALALARSTLDQAARIGGPYRSMVFRFALACAQWAVGDAAACAEDARAALVDARTLGSRSAEFSLGLIASQALAEVGQPGAADELLAEALAVGAGHDYVVACAGWLPELVARRMARALELGIHAPYVTRFVQRARLSAPDPTLESWPWPLTLRSFGAFEVRIDGEALPPTGSRPSQRPLDLLRALLANGGVALPVRTALDWLWPDAPREQQRKAFDAALLRLRRALGDDRLLSLEGAELRLDTTRCWSDVHALASIDWSPGSVADDPVALNRLGERLLQLVRGPLLDGVDEPWAMAARERARRRFTLAIEPIASRLEAHAPDLACRLYERALVADPLAESIARRLISAQLARGERGEALRAWLHCKAMLGLHGTEPSAQTRAVARQAGLTF